MDRTAVPPALSVVDPGAHLTARGAPVVPASLLSLNSIARGTIWLGCLNTLGLLLQLLFQIKAASLLGLTEFGYLAHTLSVCSFIPLLAQFGSDRVLVREIVQNRNRWREIVQASLAQRLVLGLLVSACIILGLVCAGDRFQLPVALALAVLSVISAMDLAHLFDSQGHSWKHALAVAGRYLGYLLGVVAIHGVGCGSAVGTAWMMTAVSFVFLAYQLYYAMSQGWSPLHRCSWAVVRRLLQETWLVAIATGCIQIYLQGPVVMLGFLGEKEVVGPVVIAFLAASVLAGTIGLAYRLLLPRLSAMFATSPERAIAIVRRVSPLMLYISAGCTAAAWVFAPLLLPLLGPQYASAVPLMRITLCVVPLVNWASIYGTSFLAMRRVGPYLAASAAGAATAIVLCALLVKPYGGLGCVAALAVSQVVVTLLSAAMFGAHVASLSRAPAGCAGLARPGSGAGTLEAAA
jgi:O-antigen/teichoic acid export membrane protein